MRPIDDYTKSEMAQKLLEKFNAETFSDEWIKARRDGFIENVVGGDLFLWITTRNQSEIQQLIQSVNEFIGYLQSPAQLAVWAKDDVPIFVKLTNDSKAYVFSMSGFFTGIVPANQIKLITPAELVE